MKKEIPEYSLLYNTLSDIGTGYIFGRETRPSKNRPNGLRVKRAELYHQILTTTDKEKRKRLVDDAHEYERLNQQLMEKKLVQVEVDNYGIQTASYSILKANNSEISNDPPVFLWTGISNDPEGIGWLGIEMAKITRRKVIIMGYPQGWDGEVTTEFGDGVKKFGIEPMTNFFIKATEKIAKELEIDRFCLTGMSTGATLAGDATKNQEFANRIEKVGLIAPAGCVNKNETSAKIQEAPFLVKNIFKLPYNSPINTHIEEITEEKRQKMLNVHRPLAKLMMSRIEWWKDIKQNNVKVKAIIFDNDHMTENIKIINELRKEMEVDILKGSHSTPLLNPQETIKRLFG